MVECLTRDRRVWVRSSPASLRCVLKSDINPRLVLVQPRKTCPFITERLLMGRKESNQTNNCGNCTNYETCAKLDRFHARFQKVLSEGVQCFLFFLVDKGRQDLNTTISGPS